jgi:hypothetical protein
LPRFLDGFFGIGRAFGFGFADGFTAGEDQDERGLLVPGMVMPCPEPWRAELLELDVV